MIYAEDEPFPMVELPDDRQVDGDDEQVPDWVAGLRRSRHGHWGICSC